MPQEECSVVDPVSFPRTDSGHLETATIMADDITDHVHEAAVEQLQTLGLTKYTARIYVALLRLGTATASEVSETADVPRPRVYDGIDTLHERGLVDIQYSTPRTFRAASPELAVQHFQTEYDGTIGQLQELLSDLEPTVEQHDHQRVQTITGNESIDERVPELIDAAEEEIVYQCTDELLTDAIIQRLAAAAERGVAVRLVDISPSAQERLQEAIPDAEVIESQWDEEEIARVLMIDRGNVLVSAVQRHSPPEETAIWETGEHNSLVTVFRALLD